MQAYEILRGRGFDSLNIVTRPDPTPESGQVLVRIRAVSLNYRDIVAIKGLNGVVSDEPIIPIGDGAGEVVAVGAGVTRFKPGDRVLTTYFPNWADGPASAKKLSASFGMSSDGVLAELVAVPESGLVEVPDSLSYEEASSLTCVGTTAWNALFEIGRLKAGDSVLLQGTGGLSITALQLARAAGIRVIITSSSDEKLERARNLGADGTINYIKTPEWQDEALRLTDGQGVDLVLEVGGEGTLERSIAATKLEGTVAITGGLTGMGNAPLNLFATIVGLKHLVGVWVGSAEMLKNALRVYDTGIRPVIDHVFDFSQAHSAYEHLLAGKHFGKVVIRVG